MACPKRRGTASVIRAVIARSGPHIVGLDGHEVESGMKYKPMILIADDDPHVRAALRKRVNALGYRAVEASDGVGALAYCARSRVDAVILDHDMPGADGRGIARIMRKEMDAPIIFVSRFGREDFRDIVLQLADVYYLPKPLDNSKLASLLANLLEPTMWRVPPVVTQARHPAASYS